MPGRKLTHDGLVEAYTRYESGLSVGQVAGEIGITRNALWGRFKSAGFKLRSNLRFGPENHFHRGGITASDPAQNQLEKAVQRGEVVRPNCCEVCGAAPRFKDGRSGIQGHHCDYNKPLEVMWLCQPCHHNWHKNNRAIPRRDQ